MEIVLIIFVIILLFGAKKLPELARSLGKSLNEFKKRATRRKFKRNKYKIIEDDNESNSEKDKVINNL